MHTHWINLLVASGPTHSTAALDKALNSTANAVNVTVHTVHTTSVHAAGHWDSFRQDVGDAMRIALRPLFEWCIDDTLVPSAVSVSPFAAPTAPPSAFWNAAAAARPSLPSSTSTPESLPTSSAAPLPKRVPLPTPAPRLQPSAIVSGWGRWQIAPPTATPVQTTSSADRPSPTLTTGSRLGPVAMPRVADSQPLPSHSCTSDSGLIGPRLPTSPIGSFNGTELPVPSHTCSPDDRPPKPRYIWTRRPRCPFNNGNLPDYVACPFPVGLSEPKSIFLDPPVDPRDPIIDLGPALDVILPIYIDSIVTPKRRPLQHTTTLQRPPQRERANSFYDSIWFKVGAVVLTFLFVYALYLGPPGEDFERVDLFNIAIDVVVAECNAASAKVKEIIATFPPLFLPDDVPVAEQTLPPQATVPAIDVVRVNYWDIIKDTITGFFACITRVVITCWLSVIRTVKRLFVGITCLWVSLTKIVMSIVAGIVILFIGLWNLPRKVIKWVFLATSRVVISVYVTARNIIKGSFKMVKDIIAYMSLPRFPRRRVVEQPTSLVVQTKPLSVQHRSPINPTNAPAVRKPEAGPSASQSPIRLRSLPPSAANAIRAGNAAPSRIRRAGGRRVNMARPVRATGSSTTLD